MEKRISLVAIILGTLALVLIARLGFWQIVKGGEFSKLARAQYLTGEEISAERGSIIASDGMPLATSQISWKVWADPQKIDKSPLELASILGPLIIDHKFKEATDAAKLVFLKDEEERIKKVLGQEEKRWVLVSDKVSDETLRNMETLNLRGFGWDKTSSRFYPEASTAAHLLGFVGKDEKGDRGYFGLEGFYDETLSGKSGFLRQEKDLRGNPIPFGFFSQIPANNGLDIITYIDRGVQYIAEKSINEGLEKYGAKTGSIVIMKPTGEILAMASAPAYEPERYNEVGQEVLKNPVVADSFEPGSVFKILIMAAGIDAGVVRPETKCDICTAPVQIGKYAIRTWDDRYHPDSTMEEVIVKSDNTGMVFVGNRIGKDKMYDYLKRFGIGRSTGIDLEDEAVPSMREEGKWGDIDLATASFGQGIAITPIQLMRAGAAIANHGILPTPRIVEKIQGGGFEQKIPIQDEGRIISPEAADEITKMMIAAVKYGESKWAAPRGFVVAGKTGTAQIPISGHYDPNKTMASFIGFAPADNPKFVMLITLREPSSSPWASETAAPLWFQVAKELFPYFGIQPSQ